MLCFLAQVCSFLALSLEMRKIESKGEVRDWKLVGNKKTRKDEVCGEVHHHHMERGGIRTEHMKDGPIFLKVSLLFFLRCSI